MRVEDYIFAYTHEQQRKLETIDSNPMESFMASSLTFSRLFTLCLIAGEKDMRNCSVPSFDKFR